MQDLLFQRKNPRHLVSRVRLRICFREKTHEKQIFFFQVWIGTLSHGPSGNELRATYGNTEKMEFLVKISKEIRLIYLLTNFGYHFRTTLED